MLALIRKEINTFFASPVGYLVIGLFLVLNGLFLWVFKSEFNIMDSGFADLAPFFSLAPWILLLIIPAVTMRSISEEKRQGTLELLLTKPFGLGQLVLGKYFGVYLLIIIALVPSLLYVITIQDISALDSNIDIGSTLGSYIGLFLLAAGYAAIGLFASSITANQIVAFLFAMFLCFLWYFGLDGIATFLQTGTLSTVLENLGMQLHYERISRGVLDTRDALYFASFTALMLGITIVNMKNLALAKKLKATALLVIGIIVLNVLGSSLYTRFDLTEDHRFTLSKTTISLIEKIETPLAIDILLDGDTPSEFRRLQAETRQLLESFNAINSNLKFTFINPLEDDTHRVEILEQLQRQGLNPLEVSVQENGKTALEVVVPWALAYYNKRTEKIPLLKNELGATTKDRVNSSVQQLEYAFADGLRKLLYTKQKKIAILKGNGQLSDGHIADMVRKLQEYYFIGAFTLDSVAQAPQKTLAELKEFDLIINAKPTEAFSEEEKFVLDQFIMNGGKSLWLTEAVTVSKDSLMGRSQATLAYMQDLRLNDLYFSYGIRINPIIINDLYSAPIVLASGQGKETQFTPYPWFYAPLVKSKNRHPIVTNIEGVKFDFANQIDTLKNSIKKTILLSSSPKSKKEGVPRQIKLDIIKKQPDILTYKDGSQNLAVLLEGSFKSTYKKRIKPFDISDPIEDSHPTKMVVIADGDIIKNDLQRGQPMPLGYDRYTGMSYGNKEFLLNVANYLLDESGIINVRSKEIVIPFLDMEKMAKERTTWQLVNLIFPLILLALFGWLFNLFRKKKYQKI